MSRKLLFLSFALASFLLAVPAEAQNAALEAAIEEGTKDFLGVSFGLGIGVVADLGSDDRVEKASVVNGVVRVEEESNVQERVVLEMHWFGLTGERKEYLNAIRRRSGERLAGAARISALPAAPPEFGHGPFVALQSSGAEIVDSLSLGYMWGWRKGETEGSSLNVGLGLMLDPKVQVLGDGIEKNRPLPAGETAIRFKKEERLGAVLLLSFRP